MDQLQALEMLMRRLAEALPKFRKRILIHQGQARWLEFLERLDALMRAIAEAGTESERSRIVNEIRHLADEFLAIDTMEVVFRDTPLADSSHEVSAGTLSPGTLSPGTGLDQLARMQAGVNDARRAVREIAEFATAATRDGEDAGRPTSRREVPAYTNLETGTHMIVEKRYEVGAWLSAEPPETSGAHLSQPAAAVPVEWGQEKVEVVVRLSAPDFELVPEKADEETLTFYVDRRYSDRATFEIRPRPGREPAYFSRIRAAFYVDGHLIAEAWQAIEILENDRLPQTPLHQFPAAVPAVALDEAGGATLAGSARSSVTLASPGVPPVDLQLDIRSGVDRQTLYWEMIPFQGQRVQFSTLIPGQGAYVARFLAPYAEGTPNDILPWYELAGLAATLQALRDSLPDVFWDVYDQTLAAHLAKANRPAAEEMTILIRSDNPHLPWELLPIEPEETGGRFLPRLLGSAHRVGRWVLGGQQPRPDSRLDLDGMTVVAPEYTSRRLQLPNALLERDHLLQTYRAHHLQVADFFNYMADGKPTGGAGIIHYTGHGECVGFPHRIAWLLLDTDLRYDVNMARRARTNGLGRLGHETFAFFNACKTASTPEEQALGSISSWASALIKQGYIGYVGPLWAVHDDQARQISERFYQLAIDAQPPVPLGEILRRIRSEVVHHPGPQIPITGLAYLYYGHPNAEMLFSPFDP